jgi:hypothetical protein
MPPLPLQTDGGSPHSTLRLELDYMLPPLPLLGPAAAGIGVASAKVTGLGKVRCNTAYGIIIIIGGRLPEAGGGCCDTHGIPSVLYIQ